MAILIDKILKIYHKDQNFGLNYPVDLTITIILIIICFILTSYYYTLIKMNSIKDDWSNQRCYPNIIPFAGMINRSEDESVLDATSNNFSYCVQEIAEYITDIALIPINSIISTYGAVLDALEDIIITIQATISYIRDCILTLYTTITTILFNVTLAGTQQYASVIDLYQKVLGFAKMMVYSIIATMLFIYSGVGAATMASYNIMVASWVVTANLLYITIAVGVLCATEVAIPFIGPAMSTACWAGPFLFAMSSYLVMLGFSIGFTTYFYLLRTLAIILGLTGSWKTNTL